LAGDGLAADLDEQAPRPFQPLFGHRPNSYIDLRDNLLSKNMKNFYLTISRRYAFIFGKGDPGLRAQKKKPALALGRPPTAAKGCQAIGRA
jgi:hypothetical protein